MYERDPFWGNGPSRQVDPEAWGFASAEERWAMRRGDYSPGRYMRRGPVPPPVPPPYPPPMLEPYYDDEFDRFDGYTREGELV